MAKRTLPAVVHKCPYLGFSYTNGFLLPSTGPQCALMIKGYSPCRMEFEKANWNKCDFNITNLVSVIDSNTPVFLEEIKGRVRFNVWKAHVMDN